jgi:hypothetical protein
VLRAIVVSAAIFVGHRHERCRRKRRKMKSVLEQLARARVDGTIASVARS